TRTAPPYLYTLSLHDAFRSLRYHYVLLQHGYSAGTNTIAAAATNISEIRVTVNGRVQRRISGTQLRDMNVLNGTGYDFTGVPNTDRKSTRLNSRHVAIAYAV